MEVKNCINCGKKFSKQKKHSGKQWESRKFCSKSCSATKHSIDIDYLSEMYVTQLMSSTEISLKLGISPTHVIRLLKANEIEIRCASDNKSISHSKQSTKEKIRLSKLGKPLSNKAKQKLIELTGSKNKNWGGGLTISGGYIVFTASNANGEHASKPLHVVIAEWFYGTKVKSGEHVHHIDGNKLNNNPENLSILSNSEHAKLHQKARRESA